MNGMTWIRSRRRPGRPGRDRGRLRRHGLEGKLDSKGLEVFETAARYQMYHAPAILAVGLLMLTGRGGGTLNIAGWSFTIGVLIFSGTLYALALTGIRWLGAITPIGGLALIAGWFALAFDAGSAIKPTVGDL